MKLFTILFVILLVMLLNAQEPTKPILERLNSLQSENDALKTRLAALEEYQKKLEERINKLEQEVPSPLNIFHNSQFLSLNSDGYPADWYSYGSGVTARVVHPYTHGFIGPYLESKPANAVDRIELASEKTPYWYGVYHAGPRLGRYPWGCNTDFRILHLKITGDSDYAGLLSDKTRQSLMSWSGIYSTYRVRCYVKIIQGTFGISQDVTFTSIRVTKTMSEKAPQGWYLVDANLSLAGNGSGAIGFGRPQGDKETLECYIALPYLYAQKALWMDDN